MFIILRILIYLFQIGLTLLISAIIPGMIFVLLNGKAAKKNVLALCSLLLILSITLTSTATMYLAYHPIVICSPEIKDRLTPEQHEAILGFNRGFYSVHMPVFPLFIEVLSIDDHSILVKTQYLYFGSTMMEIMPDGPNLIAGLFEDKGAAYSRIRGDG